MPVLIDFSQGVLRDHPYADELLRRDAANISKYFSGLGADARKEEILARIGL